MMVFRPGDPLPPLSLPLADGTGFALLGAGRPRLLLLDRVTEEARLARAVRAAAARGAEVVVIEATPPAGAVATAPARLFDPRRLVFAGLGLPAGGAAVISASGRLLFAAGGEDALDRALAALPEPTGASVRRSAAPVLILPGLLAPDLRARLLTPGALGDAAVFAALREAVERRLLPALRHAFRFHPARLDPPWIGLGLPPLAPSAARRLVTVVPLEDGATLRFPEFGEDEYAPAPGGALVFSPDHAHAARGEAMRLVLVMEG